MLALGGSEIDFPTIEELTAAVLKCHNKSLEDKKEIAAFLNGNNARTHTHNLKNTREKDAELELGTTLN